MTTMPHEVEVGSILNGLSNYWDDETHGRERMRDMLIDCLDPTVYFILCAGARPLSTIENKHIWEHWLGYTPASFGGVAVPAPGNTTGWWKGWQGDADAILKATFATALKVALGYPSAVSQADLVAFKAAETPTPRWWPVDTLWACGGPLFQGYIEWRSRRECPTTDRGGHVTVILATPGNGLPMAATPKAMGAGKHQPEYAVEGTPRFGLDREQGLVIVGQPVTNKLVPGGTPLWQNIGTGAIPGPGLILQTAPAGGQTTIGVFPAEDDGGVLARGR